MNTALDIINNKRKELEQAFCSVNAGRSNYQIENFVIGTHDTATRQYQQCVIELQTKTYSIRRQIIEQRKMIKKFDNEKDADEKELFGISLEEMQMTLDSEVREWNTLYNIFQSMPKFTQQEFQDAEAEYWQLRLARQSQEDIMAHGRISVGNLDALWQAKHIDNPAVAFIQQNQKKELTQ